MRTDWLPAKRGEQLVMARAWLNVLPERGTDWDVSAANITELGALVTQAAAAQTSAESETGNKVLTAKMNEAFSALTACMRSLHRRRFTTPPLIDSDYVSLGLRAHDTVRSSHITVTESVEFDLRLRNIREIVVDFKIAGAAHKAKPTGYDGAVIIWGILDREPLSHDELPRHIMASRTPYTLSFEEAERGKRVWIALAWQNERGITGPWSGYKSAIVP